MRFLLAAVAGLILSHGASANDLEDAAKIALNAGSPAAVIRALDKDSYRGNIVAAYHLGLIYHEGKLVPRDDAAARKWLKIAAERKDMRILYKLGMPDAQHALGCLLRDGQGGKADASAAASWFEQAAVQGHAPAQLALAQLNFKNASFKQNPERAFVWASIAEKRLADAEQKEAEQIRELSRKQLEPKRLANAEKVIDTWIPKSY